MTSSSARHRHGHRQLVRPFDINIVQAPDYLVASEAKADNKTVMAFSDWLKEEVMKMRRPIMAYGP